MRYRSMLIALPAGRIAMRKISRRRLFNVWAVCSAVWLFGWLFFLAIRFGRELAAAPGLAMALLTFIFGVPVVTLVAQWIFFRVRHWIARRSKHRQG